MLFVYLFTLYEQCQMQQFFLYIVFLATFFFFFFCRFVANLFHFFPDNQKKSQKLGLTHRVMRRK